VRRGEQQAEGGVRRRLRRARARVDRLLDASDHVVLHLADKAETVPVVADPRHAAIEEHEREVLGMRLAEFVVPPEHPPQRVGRILAGRVTNVAAVRKEEPEPFLRKREEEIVFAREVAVDRGGAVLDAVRDLPERDLLIAMGDEELAGRVENRSGHRLPLTFLSFFDSQVVDSLRLIQAGSRCAEQCSQL
jgi:hypothetical protein